MASKFNRQNKIGMGPIRRNPQTTEELERQMLIRQAKLKNKMDRSFQITREDQMNDPYKKLVRQNLFEMDLQTIAGPKFRNTKAIRKSADQQKQQQQLKPPQTFEEQITQQIQTAEPMDDEQKWRSMTIQINLRINGKTYSEAFNKMMDLDLNLILYLVKFLKLSPERASREVFFKRYCLHHYCRDQILQQPTALKIIQQGDTLDLVLNKQDINWKEVWNHLKPQTYVHNVFGGFKIEFLNNYIREYLKAGKGCSADAMVPVDLEKDTLDTLWIEQVASETPTTRHNQQNFKALIELNAGAYNAPSILTRRIIDRPEPDMSKTFEWHHKSKLSKATIEFDSLEKFYTFIDTLQFEAEADLVLLDFTGNQGVYSRYKLVCSVPGCPFCVYWQIFVEFRDDMKAHIRIQSMESRTTGHKHLLSTNNKTRIAWQDVGAYQHAAEFMATDYYKQKND